MERMLKARDSQNFQLGVLYTLKNHCGPRELLFILMIAIDICHIRI